MKISLLQLDLKWANPKANIDKASALIATAPGADVYLLPEMFATGFIMTPETHAEPAADSPTLRWMQATAAAHDAAVGGSIAISENGKYYNRFFFVLPDGSTYWYDKRHLFAYGGEDRSYTAGTKRTIVNFRGFRFLLQTCYDLRFPIWSRNNGNPYDVAIYVANWPSSRSAVWRALLRARAIENQCYAVGINRTGSDPTCQYEGLSSVTDARGNTLIEADRNEGDSVLSVCLDKESLQRFRKKFPVLADADNISPIP